MFRFALSLVVCLGAVGLLAGCGPVDDQPATAPTTATVTYNGTAVDAAHVTLSPDGDSGHAAFGDTDAMGKAALRTSFGDGVVPGSYKVTVTKMEVDSEATVDPEDAASEEPDEDEEGGTVVYKSVLPERYGKADTSGLTATIIEGENTFTFDLVD